MKNATVLLVGAESGLRGALRTAFDGEQMRICEADSMARAQHAIYADKPTLILLDDSLPQGGSLVLLRQWRDDGFTRRLPIVLLAAGGDEESRVEGLQSGADDVLAKPFSMRELLARVRAILRRCDRCRLEPSIEFKGLKLELGSRRVLVDEQPVTVGPTEFRLLETFLTHQGLAFSRQQLLGQVWAPNVVVGERTVDVHIQRLRRALLTDRADYGRLIQTVRGLGYRFAAS